MNLIMHHLKQISGENTVWPCTVHPHSGLNSLWNNVMLERHMKILTHPPLWPLLCTGKLITGVAYCLIGCLCDKKLCVGKEGGPRNTARRCVYLFMHRMFVHHTARFTNHTVVRLTTPHHAITYLFSDPTVCSLTPANHTTPSLTHIPICCLLTMPQFVA